jgi:peptidoglycan/LPS O-acetylase OafA/YrhL
MRQSLSENRSTYTHPPEPTTRNWRAAARAVLLAIVLSAVLVVVAIIDQTGGRSLADHVTTMYAPYGKRPDPSLLYGLVYAVAAIGALLWLLVLRVVQSRGRSAPILTVVVTTVTAALALLLLASSEYGAQIFPPLWGILAVLPPAAGILATVLLRRRSGRTVLRLRPAVRLDRRPPDTR